MTPWAKKPYASLPEQCESTLAALAQVDMRKSAVLRRYFGEMRAVIQEMHRVLKQEKIAIIVVGTSILRGIDVETHKGLAAIGENVGFNLGGIGIRHLDRDKRMMPARWGKNQTIADRRTYARGICNRVAEAMTTGKIGRLRGEYHDNLFKHVLRINESGAPNNADSGSKASVKTARGIIERIGLQPIAGQIPGQTATAVSSETDIDLLEEVACATSAISPSISPPDLPRYLPAPCALT